MRALRFVPAAQDALRGRARAQVAEITRAVRPRVRRHLTGVAAGPRQPDCTAEKSVSIAAPDAPGETPGPPDPLRKFVRETWPTLLAVGWVVGALSLWTLGWRTTVYAALLVGGSTLALHAIVSFAGDEPDWGRVRGGRRR